MSQWHWHTYPAQWFFFIAVSPWWASWYFLHIFLVFRRDHRKADINSNKINASCIYDVKNKHWVSHRLLSLILDPNCRRLRNYLDEKNYIQLMSAARKHADGWINLIDRPSKNLMTNKDFSSSSNYACTFYTQNIQQQIQYFKLIHEM